VDGGVIRIRDKASKLWNHPLKGGLSARKQTLEIHHGRINLLSWACRRRYGHPFILWPAIELAMTLESPVETTVLPPADGAWSLQWSPIIAGGLAAAAMSSILITFGATVGLGVSSTSPTWRDASIALWLLSGIYLILQALLSFGFGGYIAGRVRLPVSSTASDASENRDGLHGLVSWSLAVVLGAVLLTVVGASASRQATASAVTEPSNLSYEIDRLFRSARRVTTSDLSMERAEAGRILLTASSHEGVSSDDRAYLIQQVGTTTGLSAPDAERRVDVTFANAKKAIGRTRASSTILAFCLATALLLGAVAAWAAAVAGGKHREGPLPSWMTHSDRFGRRPVSQPVFQRK
jgi:hypothetical protein